MRLRDAVAGCDEFPGEGNVIQSKLIEFHRAFDAPILPTPTVPSDDRVRLRASLVLEECLEFLAACFPDVLGSEAEMFDCARDDLESIIMGAFVRVNLPAAADALADIAYVVEGANLEFGIDSGPVLDEVHRANMAKLGGPVRQDGKRLKPEGWTPPDIERILREQAR